MSKLWKTAGNILLFGAAIVGGYHIANGLTDGKIVRYESSSIPSRKIPRELDGYKIAFLTDLHNYSRPKLQKVVDQLNKENLDLLLLGGDFGSRQRVWGQIQLLGKVSTKDGIYGVEGNHDDRTTLFTAMKREGMTPLFNEGKNIREGLFISGLGDWRKHNDNVTKAMEDAPEKDFTILISHNPDATMKIDTTKADLVLCGHIHGGELSLFGQWAPFLSFYPPIKYHRVTEYGEKFAGGFTPSKDGTPVYTSRGLGGHSPIRVFVPPEVTILILKKV